MATVNKLGPDRVHRCLCPHLGSYIANHSSGYLLVARKFELAQQLVVLRAHQPQVFEGVWSSFRPGFVVVNLQKAAALATFARRARVRATKAITREKLPAR